MELITKDGGDDLGAWEQSGGCLLPVEAGGFWWLGVPWCLKNPLLFFPRTFFHQGPRDETFVCSVFSWDLQDFFRLPLRSHGMS